MLFFPTNPNDPIREDSRKINLPIHIITKELILIVIRLPIIPIMLIMKRDLRRPIFIMIPPLTAPTVIPRITLDPNKLLCISLSNPFFHPNLATK